jgi:catechol 2,3-dioxygenase-like lactoylglutathione lyase family enzyme
MSQKFHPKSLSVAAIAAASVAASVAGCAPGTTPAGIASAPILDTYPIVVVESALLDRTRAFYIDIVGLGVVFDSSWFVALGDPARGSIALALMAHDHPSSPPGPETYGGKGVLFTVQVADAAAAEQRMVQAGAVLVHAMRDEPWGQRRFMVRDPAGMEVDVVEQVAPRPGYWTPFMRSPKAERR